MNFWTWSRAQSLCYLVPNVSSNNIQTAARQGNPSFGLAFRRLTPQQHLKKVHGVTDATVEVDPPAVPAPAHTNDTAESIQVNCTLRHFPLEN